MRGEGIFLWKTLCSFYCLYYVKCFCIEYMSRYTHQKSLQLSLVSSQFVAMQWSVTWKLIYKIFIKVVNFSTINNNILWIVMEHLLAHTPLGVSIDMQFVMRCHSVVMLFKRSRKRHDWRCHAIFISMQYCVNLWWNERQTVSMRRNSCACVCVWRGEEG